MQRDVFAWVEYRALTESPGRWALSSPARAGDLLEMLAWTKGKRGLTRGGGAPIAATRMAVERAREMARTTSRSVQVVGNGQLDAGKQAMAEQWAAANEKDNWAKRTGCARSAIDWWMNEGA